MHALFAENTTFQIYLPTCFSVHSNQEEELIQMTSDWLDDFHFYFPFEHFSCLRAIAFYRQHTFSEFEMCSLESLCCPFISLADRRFYCWYLSGMRQRLNHILICTIHSVLTNLTHVVMQKEPDEAYLDLSTIYYMNAS